MDAETPSQDETTFQEWQAKVAGANINPQTLLATDYLNHFNEIVMLLDMVPDMPELLDECRLWEPKTYPEHFMDSTFSDRDLAVAAYQHVPARHKVPFEETIEQLNQIVAQSMHRLDEALNMNEPEILALRARAASQAMQRLMDVASAIIHGSDTAMAQSEIDNLLAH